MTNKTAFKVKFQGQELVFLKNKQGDGPLAFLDHVDEEGYVYLSSVFEDSYAHVYPDGRIMRYGEQVGTINDLEFL